MASSSLLSLVYKRTLERVVDIGAVAAGYYWFVHRPNTLEEAKAIEGIHSKQEIHSNHFAFLQNELKMNNENQVVGSFASEGAGNARIEAME